MVELCFCRTAELAAETLWPKNSMEETVKTQVDGEAVISAELEDVMKMAQMGLEIL